MAERQDGRAPKAPRVPCPERAPLDFLRDRSALIRRFVLVELLAPPVALRRGRRRWI